MTDTTSMYGIALRFIETMTVSSSNSISAFADIQTFCFSGEGQAQSTEVTGTQRAQLINNLRVLSATTADLLHDLSTYQIIPPSLEKLRASVEHRRLLYDIATPGTTATDRQQHPSETVSPGLLTEVGFAQFIFMLSCYEAQYHADAWTKPDADPAILSHHRSTLYQLLAMIMALDHHLNRLNQALVAMAPDATHPFHARTQTSMRKYQKLLKLPQATALILLSIRQLDSRLQQQAQSSSAITPTELQAQEAELLTKAHTYITEQAQNIALKGDNTHYMVAYFNIQYDAHMQRRPQDIARAMDLLLRKLMVSRRSKDFQTAIVALAERLTPHTTASSNQGAGQRRALTTSARSTRPVQTVAMDQFFNQFFGGIQQDNNKDLILIYIDALLFAVSKGVLGSMGLYTAIDYALISLISLSTIDNFTIVNLPKSTRELLCEILPQYRNSTVKMTTSLVELFMLIYHPNNPAQAAAIQQLDNLNLREGFRALEETLKTEIQQKQGDGLFSGIFAKRSRYAPWVTTRIQGLIKYAGEYYDGLRQSHVEPYVRQMLARLFKAIIKLGGGVEGLYGPNIKRALAGKLPQASEDDFMQALGLVKDEDVSSSSENHASSSSPAPQPKTSHMDGHDPILIQLIRQINRHEPLDATMQMHLAAYFDVIDRRGRILAEIAIEADNVNVLKALLALGAATLRDAQGNTLLHKAVTFGRTHMLALLISYIPVNTVNYMHQTALQFAVQEHGEWSDKPHKTETDLKLQQRIAQCVSALAMYETYVNHRDARGFSALAYAHFHQDETLLENLRALTGIDLNVQLPEAVGELQTHLHAQAAEDRPLSTRVSASMPSVVRPTTHHEDAVIHATFENERQASIDVITAWETQFSQIQEDRDASIALLTVITKEHVKVSIQSVKHAGYAELVNKMIKQFSPFELLELGDRDFVWAAVEEENAYVLDALLTHDPKIATEYIVYETETVTESAPLIFWLIKNKAYDLLLHLIESHPLTLNAFNKTGHTPLQFAISQKCPLSIVQALCVSKTDDTTLINKPNKRLQKIGFSLAGHFSTRNQMMQRGIPNYAALQELQNAALAMNISTAASSFKQQLQLAEGQLTPLMSAINVGAIEVIELLLENPALDLTIQRHDGLTAMHMLLTKKFYDCAEKAYAGIINLLLEHINSKGPNFVNTVVDAKGNHLLHAVLEFCGSDIRPGFAGKAKLVFHAILAQHGALVGVANDMGQTPLDMASNPEKCLLPLMGVLQKTHEANLQASVVVEAAVSDTTDLAESSQSRLL